MGNLVGLISIFVIGILIPAPSMDFKEDQLRYQRVRQAYQDKESTVKSMFASRGLTFPPRELLLRAFKKEKTLEVWVSDSQASKLKLLNTYKFCSSSGSLGPKRKQGDGQIPEGFYHIDRFNPASNFYLSLGINYPNKSDRINNLGNNLGGDIFIHGNCVTIGCIPITDDKIKELYLIAVEAKNAGQSRIPVHIFPSKDLFANVEDLIANDSDDEKTAALWRNLNSVGKHFSSTAELKRITIDDKGKYQ